MPGKLFLTDRALAPSAAARGAVQSVGKGLGAWVKAPPAGAAPASAPDSSRRCDPSLPAGPQGNNLRPADSCA